uniref:Iwr1 domain-containing protein n=1 Tax=Strongyloides papillosus TaxID=174720 RepID=A0A0N5BVN3_STREA
MENFKNYKLFSQNLISDSEVWNDNILFSFDFKLPSSQEEDLSNAFSANRCNDDSGIIITNKMLTSDSDANSSVDFSSPRYSFTSDEFDSYILNCPGVSSDDEGTIESCISGFIDMSDSENSLYDILDTSEDDSCTEYCTAIFNQSK